MDRLENLPRKGCSPLGMRPRPASSARWLAGAPARLRAAGRQRGASVRRFFAAAGVPSLTPSPEGVSGGAVPCITEQSMQRDAHLTGARGGRCKGPPRRRSQLARASLQLPSDKHTRETPLLLVRVRAVLYECKWEGDAVALADPAKALEALEEFRAILAINRKDYFERREQLRMVVGLGMDRRAFDHPSQAELTGLLPLIEDIAQEVDPEGDPDRLKERRDSRTWSWDDAQDAVDRLIGILKRLEDRDAILGHRGPVLAAEGLHKWVWNAAVNLWDNRHFKEAVSAAASATEEQAQLKLDRTDISGADLFTQAFNTDPPEPAKPRLRFAHIDETTRTGRTSQAWTSAHQGAMSFGRGCFQAIRNLQAHGTSDLSEREALEYLAALSVLARWVDTAVVAEVVADAV